MKPRAEYSTHSPTCVNPAGHLMIELRNHVIASSPATLFPLPLVCQIPLPMLECDLLFGGYPSCPRGGSAWPRAAPRATYYPASVGDIRPRPINCPNLPGALSERAQHNKVSPSRVHRRGFRAGPLGACGCKRPSAPASHRRFAATFVTGQHITLRSA